MTKIKTNGAKAPRMAKLKENPKQLLNQQAQDHDFLNESTTMSNAIQELLKSDEVAPSNGHAIMSSDLVDREEEKRKRIYATSMNNTLNTCGTFIALATSYGPNYLSSKPLYEIPNLQTMRDDGYDLMNGVDKSETKYKYAVAARMAEFNGLAPLCALVVAEMVISGAATETIEQLRTLIRLLRGERKVPKDPKDPKRHYISVSHMNFDDITANFGRLILMISEDLNYNPAAIALKIVTLNAKLEALIDANNAVQVATAELDAARIARNEFFNATDIGLCDVFNTAKNVVLTNFGRSSEQYMKVKGLAYRKISIR